MVAGVWGGPEMLMKCWRTCSIHILQSLTPQSFKTMVKIYTYWWWKEVALNKVIKIILQNRVAGVISVFLNRTGDNKIYKDNWTDKRSIPESSSGIISRWWVTVVYIFCNLLKFLNVCERDFHDKKKNLFLLEKVSAVGGKRWSRGWAVNYCSTFKGLIHTRKF